MLITGTSLVIRHLFESYRRHEIVKTSVQKFKNVTNAKGVLESASELLGAIRDHKAQLHLFASAVERIRDTRAGLLFFGTVPTKYAHLVMYFAPTQIWCWFLKHSIARCDESITLLDEFLRRSRQ